jgi:hypothetical protein
MEKAMSDAWDGKERRKEIVMHTCVKDMPCSQHITILLWILGVMITILSVMASSIISNENRARAADNMIQEKLAVHEAWGRDSHAEIYKIVNGHYQEIIQRLTTIETKVSVDGHDKGKKSF